MALSRLKWATIAGLAGLVLFTDLVRDRLYPQLRTLGGRLLLDGLLVVGAIFLLGLVFHLIGRLQASLESRNAELLALHRAALDISGELGRDCLPLKGDEVAHFESFDLVYRSLCAAMYNYVPASGHPGGSVSSGRFVTALLFDTMDYDFGSPHREDAKQCRPPVHACMRSKRTTS